MLNKRTSVDWSKHELTIEEHPEAKLTIHRLQIPDSWNFMVEFINVRGILIVKGDVGNWIFSRSFLPSSESDYSCSGYWKEKLRDRSCQEPSKYDSDFTADALKERISELDDIYSNEERKAKALEYYERCLNWVDDEHDYVSTARDYPSFMDSEDIIFEKKVSPQFEIVLDAYDEIVRRLKEQKEKS